MTDGRTRRAFVEMFREEWRMHSHLFGGYRFGAFPALIAILVAAAMAALQWADAGVGTVVAGLHLLALVFGLHTGVIGFLARDALRNLLGEVTLLVFSGRTLPLSRKRLLGIFVVKDVVFYALFFLLPMALGLLVLAWTGDAGTVSSVGGGSGAGTAGGGSVAESSGGASVAGTVALVALLWATLVGSFVLGIACTLVAVGLSGRGLPGRVALGALVAAPVLAWLGGVDVVGATPYGVFVAPSLDGAVAALVVVAAVAAVGVVAFGPEARSPDRSVPARFGAWNRRIGDPVATRTALDLHRSSGGVWKALFSGGVLFAVTVALVDLAERITGVAPSVAVAFGTVLGLTAFTTYNWLTQFDDVDSYAAYPVSVADVFAAKFRAFLVLGPAVGLGYYALALAWLGGAPGEAVVGALLLVGVACYAFGLTIYLSGLSPNEFLFDTVLFAVFSGAVAAVLVPVLVVGFVFAPLSTPLLAALGLGSVAIGGIGIALYRLAAPKWERDLRNGG